MKLELSWKQPPFEFCYLNKPTVSMALASS